MSFSRQDLEQVARLARLAVADDEVDELTAQLGRILDLVGRLSEVDTEGVEPMAHPLDMFQRLRPDEVTDTDQRDELQVNATQVESGFYKVPRVIHQPGS